MSAEVTSLLRHMQDASAINLLAFVGGFIDAAGYLKLYGLFTSSITGNVVISSTAVSQRTEGVLSRASVTIAFVLAGFFATLLQLKLKSYYRWKQRNISFYIFICEAIFLITSLILGITLNTAIDAANNVDNIHVIVVGCSVRVSLSFPFVYR